MPQFAANLTMLFNELPFLERFAAAKAAGFNAVEYLFPYAWPAEQLATQLKAHGLQQVLFNAPPGGGDQPAAIEAAWAGGTAKDRIGTPSNPSTSPMPPLLNPTNNTAGMAMR